MLRRITIALMFTALSACHTTTMPPQAQLDHILLGVRDLEQGIAEFQKATGVTPVRGGRHPGRGTENALVSLSTAYIEIIAPRANASDDFATFLRTLDRLTPAGWAVGVHDAESVRKELIAKGFAVSPPQPGSRITPSGETLEWVTFGDTQLRSDAVPFFIQWGATTVHPSRTAAPGCTLRSFSISDPEGDALQRMLKAVGIDVPVSVAERTAMTVTLRCGARDVTFISGRR